MSRWSVHPFVHLSWQAFGDEHVAFDQTSGQLARFDVLCAAAMACLEERPHSLRELADALAYDLGQSADAEFDAAVQDVVEQFHRLGWVTPIMT